MQRITYRSCFRVRKRFYQFIVDHGSVDGTTGKQQVTVDGFSMDVERSIVEALRRA